MSGADKHPSEPPDLPIKSATTNRRPGGTTGRSGRSRQTTCCGVISGGECTPSTTATTVLNMDLGPWPDLPAVTTKSPRRLLPTGERIHVATKSPFPWEGTG
jgi:hypothetical protein